jgi:hypothetical protein
MIRRSRQVVALGLVLALGVAALAFADGTSENEATVTGKVSPKKLDKKKYKPVKFFTQVATTTTTAIPNQQNPEVELIEFGKNIKFQTAKADACAASLNGTTTEQAEAACPPGSNLGAGVAHANLGGTTETTDVVVTAFNGPGANQLRLHAYSPTLGAANTQVVNGNIINAPSGGKYGKALSVTDAPDLGGDAFMLTLFDVSVEKSSKVVSARCKSKKFLWQRTVTYDDGTQDVATFEQGCKRKKSGNA